MPETKREILSGWGHHPVAECESFRPEKRRDLQSIVQRAGTVLARGLGRSYGDASLQPAGMVRMERLNHFISFDKISGVIRAQAGVTLSELMDIAIPAGWLPPVIPGTRHVTLGGAFACNIHGKNHWRDGDFAEHVLSIRLLLASGESIDCSPTDNSDIFWATAGGMGMTGIIEQVTLQLKSITSSSLRTITYCVDSMHDMIAAFEHYKDNADYLVGWIDHMKRGKKIGRGVFEAASHMSADNGGAPLAGFALDKPRWSVPCFLPPFLLNRWSMEVYNAWRFKKYSVERQDETVDFNGFFHPLDSIGNWNRIYGKRGFFQYQCLLPNSPDIAQKLENLLKGIHDLDIFSFLAVLKFHRDGKGLLTFSKSGYSVALDFPNTARVRRALPKIDRLVADLGGRVYLAKDALLAPELFFRMYGASWYEIIHRIDPQAKFTSLMSERLQWKRKP